jgi:hypothetical protein
MSVLFFLFMQPKKNKSELFFGNEKKKLQEKKSFTRKQFYL